MAAVLGRILTCDCFGRYDEDGMYWHSPRRGLNSSFALFYFVVFGLNAMAMGAGLISQRQYRRGGGGGGGGNGGDELNLWYIWNLVFGIVHIMAAIFLMKKIEEPSEQDYQQHYGGNTPFAASGRHGTFSLPITKQSQVPQPHPRLPQTPAGSYKRINDLLCENPVMALYILVFVAYVVWHKYFQLSPINQSMELAQKCADIFLIAGPMAFLLSSCFSMRRQ